MNWKCWEWKMRELKKKKLAKWRWFAVFLSCAVELSLAAQLHSAEPALKTAPAGSSALTADGFPRELVEFTPYEKNPIFTGAGPGHWDVMIRERGWVLREGDAWK